MNMAASTIPDGESNLLLEVSNCDAYVNEDNDFSIRSDNVTTTTTRSDHNNEDCDNSRSLFRSLSAGLDLDRLKQLSSTDNDGFISGRNLTLQSLLYPNLQVPKNPNCEASYQRSPGAARRTYYKNSNGSHNSGSFNGESRDLAAMTASLQSINR